MGFATANIRYGYQDEPDLVTALRLAREHGLAINPDEVSYYINHATILTTGTNHMAAWRKRLYALLHKNSTPAALYYGIPPDRVFEVGAFVQI